MLIKPVALCVVLLSVLSLSGCNTYTLTPSVTPSGVKPMTGQQMSSILANAKSLKDSFPGTDGFRFVLSADGMMTFDAGFLAGKQTGRWRVNGDLLCMTIAAREDCAPVYQIGGNKIYAAFKGWSKEHSTLTVE